MENKIKEIGHDYVGEFGTAKISSLFWKYSMFGLFGLAFQGISAIFNGIFVGNGIGPMGLATIGIIVPFWLTTVGLFGLFAIGGSTLCAIKLGEGNYEGARKIYGSIIVFTAYFSIALAAIVLINVEPILIFLGATPDLLPMAKSYVIPFMIGNPFAIVGTTAYYFTRAAEKPVAAALFYNIPAVAVIFIEYLCIFKWGMGMEAPGVLWPIAVGTSVLLLIYLQRSNTPLKLTSSDFKVDMSIVLEACKIGFVMFIIQIASMAATIIINNLIIKYGGNEWNIAAFSIINAYIAYILMVFTNAFITGIQPIASFNIGAKQYRRVAQLLKIGIIQSTIFIGVIWAFEFIFADKVISTFCGPIPPLVEATKATMMFYLALFAFGNIASIASGYFASVRRNGFAILNGISRIIIFAGPLFFIMPTMFGIKGIWMAQPIADLLAFILAVACLTIEYKRLMKMPESI